MKTKNNSLGFEDWQKYQSGSGGKQAEELLSGNDLNYLAARGFEKAKINAADVKDIYRRVDARSFNSASLNSIFAGGLVVMVFVGGFFLLNSTGKTQGTAQNAAALSSPVQVAGSNAMQEKNLSIENNVAAEGSAIKAGGVWKKEHFSSEKPEQLVINDAPVLTEREELVDMRGTGISSVPVENNSAISIEQVPNAPVIYYKGIKVTNYHTYYFKNNQPFQLVNGGLDAFWTDINDYKANKKELKEGNKTTADAILREAIESFAGQQYAECLANFEILLSLEKTDVNANFYSGMSFYFTGKYGKAIAYFDNVIVHDNNIFDQEAEFYKALSLKRNGQALEALELLKKIVTDNGFYAQRALEELKR